MKFKLQTGTYWDLCESLYEHGIYDSSYKHEFIKVNYRYECGCIRYCFANTLKRFESLICELEFDYCCYTGNDGRVWVYVEIEMDRYCDRCESIDTHSSMFNSLVRTLHLVQSKGYSSICDCPASEVTEVVDQTIFDALVEYCRKSSNFHVDHEPILADWGLGDGSVSWGAFNPETFDVYVNDSLVYGLMKSVNMDLYLTLEKLPITVLHEHRHALQEYKHFPMVDVPYTDPDVDFEAYHNHPTEVDARQYAEEYADEAMGYVIYVLKKTYLGHLYNK